MYVAQNITESVNLWQEVVYPPVPALKISLEQMRSAKHGEHGGACFRSAARCFSSVRSENFERKVRSEAECLTLLLHFFILLLKLFRSAGRCSRRRVNNPGGGSWEVGARQRKQESTPDRLITILLPAVALVSKIYC